jgi:hypothetical protein
MVVTTMAFQAKRLRVQIPCGEVTVHEWEVPAEPGTPAMWCPVPSKIPTPVFDLFTCGTGTVDDVDPGTLVVSPQQLAGLRRQLEARLALITDAERAIAAAKLADPAEEG